MRRNSMLFLLLFLAALSAFGPLVTDAYLPALPSLKEYFQVNESLIQMTLTTTMVGLAAGQLVAGPISDRFGRKRPLTVSLLLFTIATIGIFFVSNINALIVLRLFQGLACASGIVISRAIAKDLYDGEELRKFMIIMMMVGSIAPILSPVFGSLVLKFGGWKLIFVALSLVGAVLFVANFSFIESLPPERRLSAGKGAVYAYKLLLSSRKFMLFIAICTLMLTAMFAYIAASAFIYQDKFALTPTMYAITFGANGVASTIASVLSSRMSPTAALRTGAWLFLGAGVLIACALTQDLPIYAVIAGFMLLMFSLGFIMPTASFFAMQKAPHYAGAASAVLGFSTFFCGGLISPVVGLGNMMTTTSAVILFMAVACFLMIHRALKIVNL